jgi:hypothetical protein
VTAWRRQARAGALVLPDAEDLGFAPLVLEEPPMSAEGSTTYAVIEIVVETVVVRLPGDSPPARIAAIASALRSGLTAPGG